jgi:hypothetical protein
MTIRSWFRWGECGAIMSAVLKGVSTEFSWRIPTCGKWLCLLVMVVSTLLVLSDISIGVQSAQGEITFSRDAAPIFFDRCVSCHRPGEIAPFSLLTYSDARPWARSIKQQVLTRRMPPWFLDPSHGSFQNSTQLTAKEIETLVAWVDGGAREGNRADLPAEPQFGTGWEIGTPDLVLKMSAPFKIPASGEIPLATLPTPYVFAEDTWVQAIEIRPGNRKVVHQALALAGESGLSTSLHLYAPGLPATIFREGYGRFIPQGTRIYLRMHYNAIGQETSDQSEVAFKFARSPVHTEVRTGIADANAVAPSILQSHDAITTFPIPQGARIHAFRPHMSTRGTNAAAMLVLPDRTRRTLLSIAGWTDNWEYSYLPAMPLEVPPGAAVEYALRADAAPKTDTGTHYLYFDWSAISEANKDDRETVFMPANPLFTTGIRRK